MCQDKRTLRLLRCQFPCLCLLFTQRQLTEVKPRNLQRSAFRYRQRWFSIVVQKTRPQDFVPRDDRVEAQLQGARIERTFQPQRPRDVVSRTCRFQLIEEPQTLLRKREGQRAGARDASQGHILESFSPAPRNFDLLCET